MINTLLFSFMFIIAYVLYISAITFHFSSNFVKKKKQRPFWQFFDEEFENNQKSNAFSEFKIFLKDLANSIWLSDKELKKIENINNLKNFEELIERYQKRRNNSFKNFTVFCLIIVFIHWIGFKHLT